MFIGVLSVLFTLSDNLTPIYAKKVLTLFAMVVGSVVITLSRYFGYYGCDLKFVPFVFTSFLYFSNCF